MLVRIVRTQQEIFQIRRSQHIQVRNGTCVERPPARRDFPVEFPHGLTDSDIVGENLLGAGRENG